MSAGTWPSVILPEPSAAKVYADHAREVLLLADGKLDRDDGAAEGGLQRFQRAIQAGALAVGPRQHDDARQRLRLGLLPHLLGLHLGAGDSVHRHEHRVHDRQRRAGIAEEVREPGRVDEVDLGLVPLGVGDGGRQGVLAGDFLFVEVGDGVAFVDLAQPVDHAGIEENRRGELGLARPGMPDDRDVPDACRVVDLHRR
jgi:hypothetical protein